MTVDLPDALHDRLTKEADARGVSVKWLVSRLLGEVVETLKPPENFSLTGSTKPTEPADPKADATT
jgi:hypothetical protein